MEEILKKAQERGYTLHNYTADKKRYNFIRHDKIGLILYPQTEEFELYYNVDFTVTMNTGKAGSFMNDKHFKRIEDNIEKYAKILKNNSF